MEILKKTNYILFFLITILLLFYHLSSLLIPLTFGIFFATLIVPLSNFLEKYNVHIVLSSLISTLLLFILTGAFFYLFFYQISMFAEELPEIQEELQSAVERLQYEVATSTGETQQELPDLDTVWEMVEDSIASFIGRILDFAFQLFLVFVYVFLFLLYRQKLRDFIISFYANEKEKAKTRDALHEISKVVFHYLWGRLQVMLALAVMYYTTFLIFGLPYALLITLFGALITIIPYIGPLLSGIIPITFAIIFFDDFTIILIFSICIITIQLIESYVIEPFVIGREVRLNALTVIFAVILGGIIWGVAGMILFVPIFATIKIISNHTEVLKPLGTLLGK